MADQGQRAQLFENHLKMTRYNVNELRLLTEEMNNEWVSELPEWCREDADGDKKSQPEIEHLLWLMNMNDNDDSSSISGMSSFSSKSRPERKKRRSDRWKSKSTLIDKNASDLKYDSEQKDKDSAETSSIRKSSKRRRKRYWSEKLENSEDEAGESDSTLHEGPESGQKISELNDNNDDNDIQPADIRPNSSQSDRSHRRSESARSDRTYTRDRDSEITSQLPDGSEAKADNASSRSSSSQRHIRKIDSHDLLISSQEEASSASYSKPRRRKPRSHESNETEATSERRRSKSARRHQQAENGDEQQNHQSDRENYSRRRSNRHYHRRRRKNKRSETDDKNRDTESLCSNNDFLVHIDDSKLGRNMRAVAPKEPRKLRS